jgi:hypothetical protein
MRVYTWLTAAATLTLALPGAAAADPPPESTFFSTASIEEHQAVGSPSDGDLWPSCWSSDDNLYAANGDGKGFSLDGDFSDIAVSRIAGTPAGGFSGETLAKGDGVGQVWANPADYTRKPTGMACVNGSLYLAVQDLARDFNDVPNATIARSDDHGRTWTWDRTKPMFNDHTFTTIMFLDFGKDNANAVDGYVYAYGLDQNWRDSFNDRVPDPDDVYLARVPKDRIQDRSAWRFYAGTDAMGQPHWSADIAQRRSVLHDDRRLYPTIFSDHVHNLSVISQGGVVYDKPLKRYLYTSWTEYTFEFYESPTPWGPWKHFLTKDFGGYPWTAAKHGGYATTIPSKFIGGDGKSMWVQSNVCPCGGGGTSVYHFSLRRLTLEPRTPSRPDNPTSDANLAVAPGTVPVERVAHFGNNTYYNDGRKDLSEDDWNDEAKTSSWWGYTWPKNYNLNKVVYTTGQMFPDGGWFAGNLRVQVRRGADWIDVGGATVTPAYPYDNSAGPFKSYTISFPQTWGDGIRVIGTPGGSQSFTSIAELEVYYN